MRPPSAQPKSFRGLLLPLESPGRAIRWFVGRPSLPNASNALVLTGLGTLRGTKEDLGKTVAVCEGHVGPHGAIIGGQGFATIPECSSFSTSRQGQTQRLWWHLWPLLHPVFKILFAPKDASGSRPITPAIAQLLSELKLLGVEWCYVTLTLSHHFTSPGLCDHHTTLEPSEGPKCP